MKTDDFGDRMKMLEGAETSRRFLPLAPICARMDGKSFHTWTADCERPYDKRLSDLMIETTKSLVKETGAKIGYCQSDEISLIFHTEDYNSTIYFEGRISKMVSVLASLTTGFFNRAAPKFFGVERPIAFFDARVWSVGTKWEAANAILWREQDAAKNSISMAAQKYFSHSELQGKSGPEMQEMLFKKHDINWNSYPPFFKRGSFIQRRTVKKELSAEEFQSIPEKFRPATNLFERSEIAVVSMPKFSTVVNRVEVIFDGQDPQTIQDPS